MNDGFIDQYLELLSEYDVVGALWTNIELTIVAGLVALVLGTALALMRVSPIGSLRWAGSTYVTVFRNTPLTIIVVFCVLGLWGQLGVTLAPTFDRNFFLLAALALAVYHAAFVCEAVRSGVNTVPLGQSEAARALGFNFWSSARLIVFPQAFRGAVAPLGNTLIALTKNSTVAAAASVAEASSLMKTMIEFRSDLVLAIFFTFALGFVVIVIPIGLVTTSLSRRLAVAR